MVCFVYTFTFLVSLYTTCRSACQYIGGGPQCPYSFKKSMQQYHRVFSIQWRIQLMLSWRRRWIIQESIEYRSVWSLRPNWLLPPPLPQASVSPPGAKGGHTRLRVRGRGSQFVRLERKPGTLSILQLVVYPSHLSLVCSDVGFNYVVYWAKWEGCIILTPFVYLYSIEIFVLPSILCPFENRTLSWLQALGMRGLLRAWLRKQLL